MNKCLRRFFPNNEHRKHENAEHGRFLGNMNVFGSYEYLQDRWNLEPKAWCYIHGTSLPMLRILAFMSSFLDNLVRHHIVRGIRVHSPSFIHWGATKWLVTSWGLNLVYICVCILIFNFFQGLRKNTIKKYSNEAIPKSNDHCFVFPTLTKAKILKKNAYEAIPQMSFILINYDKD